MSLDAIADSDEEYVPGEETDSDEESIPDEKPANNWEEDEELKMLMVVNPDLEFFNEFIRDHSREERWILQEKLFEQSLDALDRLVGKVGWNIALTAPPLQELVKGAKI